MSQSTRRGLTFTREQVEEWIGHCITDDELEELERVLPYSSLPNCVETVAHEALNLTGPESEGGGWT